MQVIRNLKGSTVCVIYEDAMIVEIKDQKYTTVIKISPSGAFEVINTIEST